MQEEITHRSVVLTTQSAKITGRVLQKMVAAALRQMKQPKRGKQTVKQLAKHNAGLSNIEITDANIKSFEKVARKYGVDFALRKDTSLEPPRWLVFFKARDADALTAAFNEFSRKAVTRDEAERPSVRRLLSRLTEQIKNMVIDRAKHKNRSEPER